MLALSTSPSRERHRKTSRSGLAALLLLAVGLAAVAVGVRKNDVGEKVGVATRPGPTEGEPRRPLYEILVKHDGQLLPISGLTLSSRDEFAVRYTNPYRETRYLAAFAIDAVGAVHWIAPKPVAPSTNAPSIHLPTFGGSKLLPEVVAPDHAAPGPMRVLGLVSREPTSIKQIEDFLRNGIPDVRDRSAWASVAMGTSVREWRCTWKAR